MIGRRLILLAGVLFFVDAADAQQRASQPSVQTACIQNGIPVVARNKLRWSMCYGNTAFNVYTALAAVIRVQRSPAGYSVSGLDMTCWAWQPPFWSPQYVCVVPHQ
jgi:hypothetical protein